MKNFFKAAVLQQRVACELLFKKKESGVQASVVLQGAEEKYNIQGSFHLVSKLFVLRKLRKSF